MDKLLKNSLLIITLVLCIIAYSLDVKATDSGIFKMAKVAKESKEKIAGAKMEIHQNGLPLYSFTSTEDFYSVRLSDGEYELFERAAPIGYNIAQKIPFKVIDGKLFVNDNEVDSVTMEDEASLARLTITKIDSETGERLPGVKYKLWGTSYNGEYIELTATTDENGEIVFENLPVGDYEYKEIETLPIYTLDNTIYDVKFASASEAEEVEAVPSGKYKEACEAIINTSETFKYQDYDEGYSSEDSEYEDVFGNGTVYRGGNSLSQLQGQEKMDNDPNDFTKILPYATVYIDVSRINWETSENYIIDIQDPRFKWIQTKEMIEESGLLVDNEGNTAEDINVYARNQEKSTRIAYVGPVKAYLDNLNDPWEDKPLEDGDNVFLPEAGKEYLFRVTYKNAAILPNGERGDVVLSFKQVIIESSTTTDYAVIGLFAENSLSFTAKYLNEDGKALIGGDGNARIPTGTQVNGMDVTVQGATGVNIDFDIEIKDKNGNPVDGTISYAASDLDFENYQSVWGRPLTGENAKAFNEGLQITSGTKSYAVVPMYDHADATSKNEGWIIARSGTKEFETPLHIGQGNGTYADGVKFSGQAVHNPRGEDGTYNNVPVAATGQIQVYEPAYGGSQTLAPAVIRNQLYDYLVSKGYSKPKNQMTRQDVIDYTGVYISQRNDEEGSFDTGFAVLIDAKKTSMRWSASGRNTQSVGTILFMSSIYRRVQQSHGSGGDIYIESYDPLDNCNMNIMRGDATVGIGDRTVHTILAEEEFEIDNIKIDDETIDYNDLNFEDGIATWTSNNGTVYTFVKDPTNPKKVTVSFDNITENHAIQVNFRPDKNDTRANTKSRGNLIIKKIVEDDIVDTSKEFSFTLTLSDTTINGPYGELEFIDGVSNFTLRHNQSVTVENILSFTEYEIVENNSNSDGYIILKNKYTGSIIGGEDIAVTFTNIKTYDLEISKKVTGDMADKEKSFEFQIELIKDDNPLNGTYEVEGLDMETLEFTDGKATVSLRHSQSIKIKALPYNTQYQISETYNDYDPTITISDNISNLSNKKGVALAKLNKNHSVLYTNNKSKAALTGLILNNLPFVGLTLMGIILVLLVNRKNKQPIIEQK